MVMAQPQTTQLLLHGVIEARILEADLLSVTTDGKLQPSKKTLTKKVLSWICCKGQQEQELENAIGLGKDGKLYATVDIDKALVGRTRMFYRGTDDSLWIEFKALSQFYKKLPLDIHIMSLWTIDDHHVLLDISVERITVNVYDSRGSQLEDIHPFIEALNKAYEKSKSKSKKPRELGRSRFQVVSISLIPMQPAGNDLCGFYVMHYMRSLINALISFYILIKICILFIPH
ncbi:unnamed protein product [Miscanthus lutarioriparius]|uniref:Ubiquitin-like protease family profile domain-containing protein n=1 Tax=Miscanthus lutarioriparius TaxID=422564 RepID=A0A811MS28_9POAL|nr:unnamed protein product [Miscanthus lutarioriparius]